MKINAFYQKLYRLNVLCDLMVSYVCMML
jgi:hypothetical protein